MLIVIIDHGDGKHSYRGPFDNQTAADQFADWATREIDPAHVARLGDPLTDMLCAPVQGYQLDNRCPSRAGYEPGDVQCDGKAGHGPDHQHRDPEGGVTLWRTITLPNDVDDSPVRCGFSVECNRAPGHDGIHNPWPDDDVQDAPVLCGHAAPTQDLTCEFETGHAGEHLNGTHRRAWPGPGETCDCPYIDPTGKFRKCIRPAGHLPDHRSETGYLWVNDKWNDASE